MFDRKPPSFGLLCRAPRFLKEVPRTDCCCYDLGTPDNKQPVFLLHRLSLDWNATPVHWWHHFRLLLVFSPSILISLCCMRQQNMLSQFNDSLLLTLLLNAHLLGASYGHCSTNHHQLVFTRARNSGISSVRQSLLCGCQRNLLRLLSSQRDEFRGCLVL